MAQGAHGKKPANKYGTVARTLAVLTIMAEFGSSVGVTDVATALDLPMSTAHRLLDLLRREGFLERDAAQRRYRIGLQFLRIAQLVSQNTVLARLCQPVLERISAETGETALFCEYLADNHMTAYTAKSDSTHSLRYRITLFAPAPIECDAAGLAILSFLPPPVRAVVCATPRSSPFGDKRLSSSALADQINTTRRKGFAFSSNDRLPGSISIAVPVRMSGEQPNGSLTLTIPESRFVRSNLKAYVALLSEQARLLSITQTT